MALLCSRELYQLACSLSLLDNLLLTGMAAPVFMKTNIREKIWKLLEIKYILDDVIEFLTAPETAVDIFNITGGIVVV